jgi:HlyD family secretion protein
MKTVPLLLALLLLVGCRREGTDRVQGYVEGEFVHVASPLGGQLEKLSVRRGDQVSLGDPLFALESAFEKASRDEAARRLAQALANLEDVKKGRRPEEIAALEAQIEQAKAALALAEKEKLRQQELLTRGVVARQEVDRTVSTWEQDWQRVAQLEADLQTARLGARADQIDSAASEVRAREAALARADWDVAQKQQPAPRAGLVFDTLYREGEWVPAARPVVILLPPENIKVRAFVSEELVSQVRLGAAVHVWVDGRPDPSAGKVSFVSPQAEYTPPVIYSRETRGKLVFMIEALFEPTVAAQLHPGQPVELELKP